MAKNGDAVIEIENFKYLSSLRYKRTVVLVRTSNIGLITGGSNETKRLKFYAISMRLKDKLYKSVMRSNNVVRVLIGVMGG